MEIRDVESEKWEHSNVKSMGKSWRVNTLNDFNEEKPQSEKLVLWFKELRKGDIPLVGGKNANLGEMTQVGIPVPPGFAITAYAYKEFLAETGIAEKIYGTIRETVTDINKPQQYEEASQKIREIIESTPMPREIQTIVEKSYEELSKMTGSAQAFVAVRSSATAEDLPGASFAGQQDTFLNVKGAADLIDKTVKCWSSLFTPRAIFYRTQKNFKHEDVLISVGVQKMVNSKAAGVAFTINPVTGEPDQIVIEGNWGLGESVVSGSVTPDDYIVDKTTLKVTGRRIAKKMVEYIRDPQTGKTIHADVPSERQEKPCLNDEEIVKLAEFARLIENHYGGKAQDIEWAIDRDMGFPENVFIVQSRPETVWASKVKPEVSEAPAFVTERNIIVKGLPASPGIHAGKAKVAMTTEEANRLIKKGDILVTKMTTPDWVPYMRLAGAILTNDGGMTCHAAIVSREMGIPCVVGTENATEAVKSGQDYTVDAKTGVVYEGLVEELVKPVEAPVAAAEACTPVTGTKIYVNLSIPEIAEKVYNESKPDGVGLLRAEHLMLSVGKHPRLLIEEGGEERMVNAFAESIRKVAEALAPGPVVYRFLDFKPDEFLSLPGGEKYELEAGHVGPNPLIGYRGCFRYVKEPDVFRLECRAIKKVREEFGLKNLHVMLPFVRTIKEFRVAKKIMGEEGLIRGLDFKLWIMVEVPSSGILIDKFIEEGIDGVSFGTNDYTMLILGLDRNDAAVQEVYDERNLAVLRLVSHVIRICREHGVTTSICGQAPSNYPEYLEFLIREGATSISVNPDVVNKTRLMVASIEQKLTLEELRKARERVEKEKTLFEPKWSKELE
jgi:pyruvate,water dikinase